MGGLNKSKSNRVSTKNSSLDIAEQIEHFKPQKNEKEEPEVKRQQWSSPTEFTLTCIGYSVGLGNVWRFPYLCYTNGGGAFLIPYMIMICIIGMPLLFMEYGFGQYFGIGSLSIFKRVCPLLQGIGPGYIVLNGLVCIYYNVIIAISIYYLFASLQYTLPWSHCGNQWNTPLCGDASTVKLDQPSLGNSSTGGVIAYGNSSDVPSLFSNLTAMNSSSPSDEYFRLALLGMGKEHSIEYLGSIRWQLCLCLLLAWVLVCMFVSKGIKSTGKVAYFTATFPYVMLTVLVIRGVTLPGAADGIMYFITPDWKKLSEPTIWFNAASQLFYSTNLAWGGMITMSSYSTFNHNCFKDAIMINLVSFFTSIYAGIAVFSIIGYMAMSQSVLIKDVIESGPGLAFVVYPRALSLMPLAPVWNFLFFFMLFLLGIGSQMVGLETVMSGILDEFPNMRKYRIAVLITVSTTFFFAGIAMVTQGGMYVLQIFDHYSASFSVFIIAIAECVGINYLYGSERFSGNIKEMLDKYPAMWWRMCWKYISPAMILAILIFSLSEYKPVSYGEYVYPKWADMIGWCLCLSSAIPLVVVAFAKIYSAQGTLSQRFSECITPNLPRVSKAQASTIEMEVKIMENGEGQTTHL